MIGYDRPLKPEWIYQTLRTIEPGRKPQDFYDLYNDIAVELTGKDGRRKTRTVLYRTFIYSFQETEAVVQDNMLIQLCKSHDLAYMKPILLSKFIVDYEILRYFTEKFSQIFDPQQDVNTFTLTTKMVEAFGDAEIVRRSTRSFLKTLVDFDILKIKDAQTYQQLPRQSLSPEQVFQILKLYAGSKKASQVDIQHWSEPLFDYYQQPDLNAIANRFHPEKWEYIKGADRGLLMMSY